MAHSTQTDMINKKYFMLNYPLANSLIVLAVLFHIWSGGSEFLGLQGYMNDFIQGKFPDSRWAAWAALVIPLLLAITIEFSFVALLRYLLNSLLYKTLWRASIAQSIELTHALAEGRYRAEKQRYEDAPEAYGLNRPEAPERPDAGMVQIANVAMYLMALAAFVAVFAVSMTVSKKSIQWDTLVNGPEAKIHPIDSLDQQENQRKKAIYELLDRETAAARQAYQRDSLGIEAEYAGKIASKEEKLREYDIRARQTDQSYSRSKSIRRQQIQDLKAGKAARLVERSTQLVTEEKRIREQYEGQLAAITGDYAARRENLKEENHRMRELTHERNLWFSNFLKRYAQLATVGQFMCWVYVILAYYVMGIRKKPRVRPESLESGLLSDLGLLLYTAPTRVLHNQVRGLLSKVPPLYQMPGVGAVYDIDTLNELAPLLEQLDKAKSLEEKQKLQRAIQRKIAGYQLSLPEGVESVDVESVENDLKLQTDERRKTGIESDPATRRKPDLSTPRTGVEMDVEKRRKDVETTGVESAVERVATRSTGVESHRVESVETGVESAVLVGVENVENGRRKSVENSGVESVATLPATRVEKTAATDAETAQQPRLFAVDVREQALLKAQYEGEEKEEWVEIRVVIDGIKVKGYYHDDYHPHAFFKKMKQNYEGYFRRQQRNMLTNLLRIELAERYMELIERVGGKHDLAVRSEE